MVSVEITDIVAKSCRLQVWRPQDTNKDKRDCVATQQCTACLKMIGSLNLMILSWSLTNAKHNVACQTGCRHILCLCGEQGPIVRT